MGIWIFIMIILFFFDLFGNRHQKALWSQTPYEDIVKFNSCILGRNSNIVIFMQITILIGKSFS